MTSWTPNRSPVAAPHVHGRTAIPQVMRTVLLALLPATATGVWLFGWPALNMIVLSIAGCVAAEAAALAIGRRALAHTLGDGSAVVTGLILALCLPPWAPWWLPLLGGAFAIVVGKQVFGGLGQNVLNPAMLARVALLVSFPLEMTAWVAPQPLFSAAAPGFLESLAITFGAVAAPDAVSAATALAPLKTGGEFAAGPALIALGLGTVPGSLGETSALALLAGGALLIARRIVPWQIPAALLGTLALLAAIFNQIDPAHYAPPLLHLLGGSALMCAFFIATDPVGAPVTPSGRLIFGAGIGALIYAIRTWGGYPEGVAFAVLLLNAATPLIDHLVRPRRYGRLRSGAPLPVIRREDGR
ncbi:RnfABCDGE type electron transport complex subunit D [Thauera sp.]|jgi:electron transport complex protein RnfD|uniref:RnfABCDGE type electron transport complex subunit D n=1 Tax=Thauera sp. TaxID=1905334 RepID=UPI0026128CB7|nr:RnfABCDGE type electron transport complex subunit D [Thauera sp.]MCK6410062.1 RnfABCDGE type electron transport complex subunit D [Thauera sp.]